MLYEDKAKGRKAIFDALTKLNKITASRPNSVNLQIFCYDKLNEIKNLYLDAEAKDKTDVVNLLKKIDPVNSSKYEQILN